MASFRHLSRIAVVQALFAYEFQTLVLKNHTAHADPEVILDYILREFGGKITDSSFACELLTGVIAYTAEIREQIARHAPTWPFEKIAPTDRAILEVGIYEILHSPDVPPVVAIDEAVEISKILGGDASSKFVNGVLSAVMEANPITGHSSAESTTTKQNS